MRTRLNPAALTSNWGGILNLSLGSRITTEECLEIVKKLEEISQNKFYTINVWDTERGVYLGDCEFIKELTTTYVLTNFCMNADAEVIFFRYRFFKDGTYDRHMVNCGKIKDIASRLDAIEQQLGI